MVRVDPVDEGDPLPRRREGRLLFCRRAARTWEALKLNLPTVRVTRSDRQGRRPRRRHERPIDLDPRRPDAACAPRRRQADALLTPRPAYRWRTSSEVRPPAADGGAATTRRAGRSCITACRRRRRQVTLEILDGTDGGAHADEQEGQMTSGPRRVLRRGAAEAAADGAGLHRVVWDLRHKGRGRSPALASIPASPTSARSSTPATTPCG